MNLDDLSAITFDFGNTLVPVDRAGLRRVVDSTARAVVERCGPFEVDAFLVAWADERERQFREEVPRSREVDLEQRVRRVLARLRGMAPPPPDRPWDDVSAAAHSTPDEVSFAVRSYSDAFVEAMPSRPRSGRCSSGWRAASASASCRTGRSRSRSTTTPRPQAGCHR